METYNIIATPSNEYNDPNYGEVKILFYYDVNSDNAIPLTPTDEIFKSKCVWIISDYDTAIKDKYAPGELFLLSDIQPTRHSSDNHSSTRIFHDWCGRGKNASRLTNEFIPVIEADLPDIDSGVISIPPTDLRHGLHFIESGDSVYGPFDISISEGVTTATPSRPMAVSGTNDHITKTSTSFLVDEDLIFESKESFGGARKFIASLKGFGVKARCAWEEIDYISSRRIFKQLLKAKGKNRSSIITKKELGKVEQAIEQFLKSNQSNITSTDRLDRALRVLTELQGDDEWFSVIESYVNTDEGKKALNEHYREHPQNGLSSEDLEGLNAKHQELEIKISNAETKLQNVNLQRRDVEDKVREEVAKSRQIIESKNDELRAEQKNLLEGLEKIKNEGLDLKEKYKQYQTLAELENAIKIAEEVSRDVEGSKRTMERAVKRQQELLATPESLAAELTSVHTVMQSLGYATFSASANARDLTQEYNPEETALFDEELKSTDLIVTLAERINSRKGKTLSSVEVGNLLICMQQHILVILKGRPGVGKTSSAIKMAEALGIKTDEALDADYLNVPVARGWSSSRDLLGYYNSLRGEFQPAKTGVYQFLRNGDSENSKNVRMILLDEANLSPIEHYWSDFIGLCDPEGSDRPIITGSHDPDERYLRPNKGNNLRFLATINSDATVEPLSDRLLDRAPVVCMDTSDEHEINGDILAFSGAISNDTLEDMFGRKDLSEVDVTNSIEQITAFLSRGINLAPQLGNCLYIDGRRRINIEQYLSTAETVFENDTIARDFAVAQFVLPHLRCDGNGMEDAIKALIQFCEERNWERSEDILQGILERGDKYLMHYSFL